MKIEVLGSYGGESLGCRMTCLLFGDTIALDAGSLTQAISIERQSRVRSILLTHSHVDHTNSLPFFIENVYGRTEGPIHVYASPATIYAVRKHLFNNASWPDFSRLPNNLLPSVQFHELAAEIPITIDGIRFTPFKVDHLVPTYGFLIEQRGAAVLWSSDTGPTIRLWEIANQAANLKAILLDTSFENAMQEIADVSLHLTPATLDTELKKLERSMPILLHHLKPPCADQIRAEVRALHNPDVSFLEQGQKYSF